ncbi:MAG: hypothetical protein J6S48_06680, partial [Bacteroidales bacterium]|nr:hypothetical protein [Bacteroidales bacterium]
YLLCECLHHGTGAENQRQPRGEGAVKKLLFLQPNLKLKIMEQNNPIEEARRYVANAIIDRCAMLYPGEACA